MIISHRPSWLQGFFGPIQSQLSKPRFRHPWSLILALAVNLKASKLSHLAAAPKAGHRTGHGSFLCGDWGAAALVERACSGLLASMRPRAGEVVSLLLGDTRIAKRGKRMARVSKIWDHKQQKFVRGHVVLLAAVRFRGVVLPWRVELWKPKGQAASAYAPRYRKLTDMAAALVKAFEPPQGVKVRVLFDAFYLCPQVAKACGAKGFNFFSVAAKNRSFKRDGGGKGKKGRKIAALAPGLVRYHGKGVRMKRARGVARLRLAWADGNLSRIGRARLVLSKRPRDPWKKVVAVVTNETKLKAREVVAVYETRWDIEVLFKELRQDLGLGDYQVMSEGAIVNHLHPCCLAHQLLTHHALRGAGAQARKANARVKLPTMTQRLEDLRRRIAREQIGTAVGRIAKGEDHEKLRRKLRHYLREHLPAA